MNNKVEIENNIKIIKVCYYKEKIYTFRPIPEADVQSTIEQLKKYKENYNSSKDAEDNLYNINKKETKEIVENISEYNRNNN